MVGRRLENAMSNWIDISFDCLPLRTIGRLDIPLDASPAYRARCDRLKTALEKHGAHNAYYLYNAQCKYHLTNREEVGTIQFQFEGTLLTDAEDARADRCDLSLVELTSETCQWLTEPIVRWFADTVPRSVAVEFDRYIDAGDLQKAKDRIDQIQSTSDDSGGYVGMYL